MAGTDQGGYWFAAAIRASDLPPTARLVALVIVGQADNESGLLTRSLTQLAKDSGLHRATVVRQLGVLEGGGWLKRAAPTTRAALGAQEMTTYTTVIPAGFPSRTTRLGLGAESARPGRTTRHSPYRTKAGGPSASAPAPAAGTTRTAADAPETPQQLPASFGDTCPCDQPGRTADDSNECFRCGGAIPA